VTSTGDDDNDGCHGDEDENKQGHDDGVQRPLHGVRAAACQSNQRTHSHVTHTHTPRDRGQVGRRARADTELGR